MQCSFALPQPLQSPPQQSFRHAPATQIWPAAQSVHAAQEAPLPPGPAAAHEGVTALFIESEGTHEALSAGQPADVW